MTKLEELEAKICFIQGYLDELKAMVKDMQPKPSFDIAVALRCAKAGYNNWQVPNSMLSAVKELRWYATGCGVGDEWSLLKSKLQCQVWRDAGYFEMSLGDILKKARDNG